MVILSKIPTVETVDGTQFSSPIFPPTRRYIYSPVRPVPRHNVPRPILPRFNLLVIMASTTLPSSANYLIVGGGTAGLVVACRLSENPDVHVVVLESGPDRTQDPQVRDPNAWRGLSGSDLDWKLKTVPQVCSYNIGN